MGAEVVFLFIGISFCNNYVEWVLKNSKKIVTLNEG